MKRPSLKPRFPYREAEIAVLGAGESGAAAAILLAGLGARVTVFDSAPAEKLAVRAAMLAEHGIHLVCGSAAEQVETVFARVILSPGIDPSVPLVQHFHALGAPMVGELEMASEMCECPAIAITGTNGKTTTTQLTDIMLNACGIRTVAAGNIGPAFSGRVAESGSLDVITLEVSSFQLETVAAFHPAIAVWLNFAPDHLDRYHSIEEYRAAKLRIFENQTEEDRAIVNARDILPPGRARRITFSAYSDGADFSLRAGTIHYRGERVLAMGDTCLRGVHNAENLMAALGIGVAMELGFAEMVAPLCGYRPLPHRCEPVRTLGGVEWVNDSKGTNPDAVEKALLSEDRRVVLIAGGKDKGFEYDTLTELVVSRCRAAVVLGEMAPRIEELWRDRLPCSNAGRSLATAVEMARAAAQPGDVVLFSPGTSSFDMFSSYADRGNQFRALVQALPDPAAATPVLHVL